MATVNKTFLDLNGLQTYDTAIKGWANGANQIAFKKIIQDGDNYKFYKNPEAVGTDTPDATINVNGQGAASKTIWLKDDETVTTGYLKTYGLYQGANSPTAATNPATLIGKIDIPKDLVVTAGKVVTVTSGVDSDGESTSVADGTYLKLTIANQTTKVYINVADLADTYTPEANATEVQLAISNANVISASVVAIDGAKVGYKAESSAGAGDSESVKAALTRLDGNDSTTGSVAKKIKDAIGALDTSSDVSVASYTAGTSGAADVITLTGSVKEEDGLIAAGIADNITLSTITTAQINALFS